MAKWDESKHPRGKTSKASRGGSFKEKPAISKMLDNLSSPHSIANSLMKAAETTANYKQRVSKALDALPEGYEIKYHGREYKRQTIAGDPFWIDSKGSGYTSNNLREKLGTALVPHIGEAAFGFKKGSWLKETKKR